MESRDIRTLSSQADLYVGIFCPTQGLSMQSKDNVEIA
jgi:hypothetical protein